MLLGVDVGGTFTDAALLDGERLHTAKVATTPGDESRGVLAAIEAALAAAAAEPAAIEVFTHGMTVGTNALLEQRGARTALIATRGFGDLLEIGRQSRPSLYHPCRPRPPALADPELRLEAAERVGPEGVVEALSDEEVERLADAVAEGDAESVAICLLFAFSDPSHESRIAQAVRRALPDVHVSVSHEVLPAFREYERCSTTVIDAYLSPLLGRYLTALADACAERGVPVPLVMRSSGGTATAAEAARSGAWSVLSGPAGGAVAAASLAGIADVPDVLGFDMGGTSCDVCVVEGGEVRRTDSREIDGRPIQLPMVDVHTVGAGGGSIGWRDEGGALRVGPRSAGAEPGPACYGRGGTEPTVTDANLMLGYLAPASALAGGVELDAEAAETSVGALGEELGLDPIETAEGIVRVANQEMLRALRVMTVERGVDPRGFALLPFGGAGPMHAAAMADDLEISRILCPRASGVLSALGLIAAGRRQDTARTVMLAGPELTAERVEELVGELADVARRDLDGCRAGGRLRAALPGPSIRAADPGRAAARRSRSWPKRSRTSTRRVTATATPRPSSSSSDCGLQRRCQGRRCIPAPRWEWGSSRAPAGRASGASGQRPAWCAASRRRDSRPRARACWSCRRRRSCCRRGGPPGWTTPGQSPPRGGTDEWGRPHRPGHPPGAGGRTARGLRGDGSGPDPQRLLVEHQGAPRLLDRALRRRGRARHAGGAHSCPPRLHAGRRGGDRRRAPIRGRPLGAQRPLPRRDASARRDPDLPDLRRAA